MEGTVQRVILDSIFTSTLGVSTDEALRKVGLVPGNTRDTLVKRRRTGSSKIISIEEVTGEEEKGRESKRACLPSPKEYSFFPKEYSSPSKEVAPSTKKKKKEKREKSISIGDMFIPLPNETEFSHVSIGGDGKVMVDGELYYNTETPESGFWPMRKGKEPK
jgi:hypothetical protein